MNCGKLFLFGLKTFVIMRGFPNIDMSRTQINVQRLDVDDMNGGDHLRSVEGEQQPGLEAGQHHQHRPQQPRPHPGHHPLQAGGGCSCQRNFAVSLSEEGTSSQSESLLCLKSIQTLL